MNYYELLIRRSRNTGGGSGTIVTYTLTRTSGSDSYVANAIGTYSLISGTEGSTDAVYKNGNGWYIYFSSANRWALGPDTSTESFINMTGIEGEWVAWDYECNDNLTVSKTETTGTESGGGSSGGGGSSSASFPDSFSVTSCSGNGAAVGQYAKTSETTTVNGVEYPVYSIYKEFLGTTFYIFVCEYRYGEVGAYWALNGDSYYASSLDGYSTLGSVAVGADGIPSSTVWTAASSEATVSWS
jgi:hypothetical protein